MDLAQFDSKAASDQGAVLHVRNPRDGKPLIDEQTKKPVTITLLGMDSKRLQDLISRQNEQRLNSRLNRKGKLKVDIDELNDETLDVYATATVAWTGIILDKRQLECTHENAKTLYKRFDWLREQVDEFINEREHFLGNSERASSSGQGKSSNSPNQ